MAVFESSNLKILVEPPTDLSVILILIMTSTQVVETSHTINCSDFPGAFAFQN